MELYLKWTRTGRVPSYRGGEPIPYRKWTDRVDDPVLCERGWHACRWEDVLYHIFDELWVVELDGPIVEGHNKVAGTRLRIVRKVSGINERTLRLFAADCAESVLHLYEDVHPGDDRPRKAIEAARRFANGEISEHELAAARDAAWAAGRAAAWAAAWAAGRAAAWAAAWDRFTTDLLVKYGDLNPDEFAHRQVAP